MNEVLLGFTLSLSTEPTCQVGAHHRTLMHQRFFGTHLTGLRRNRKKLTSQSNECIVVSNTTLLISLVGIGQLELLPRLYTTIVIPQAVLAEYRAGARPDHPRLETLSWIVVHTTVVEPTLAAALDRGEAEAVSLALALQARVILLDERHGRRIAQQQMLPVIGSLGVLLRTKQAALIPAVTPFVDAMVAQGRHISPILRANILAAAGETEA